MMSLLLWAIDMVLVASLCGVAWFAIATSDLFKGVVLFIVFGLLLSLAWLRLQAPDVALAEAALGAGITGALLLSTLGQITNSNESNEEPNESAAHDINST